MTTGDTGSIDCTDAPTAMEVAAATWPGSPTPGITEPTGRGARLAWPADEVGA